MMRRTVEQERFGVGALAQIMVLTAMVAGSAIIYVVQDSTNKTINDEISKREKKIAELDMRIQSLQSQVADHKNMELIRRRVAELRLPLQEITDQQRLWPDTVSLPSLEPKPQVKQPTPVSKTVASVKRAQERKP